MNKQPSNKVHLFGLDFVNSTLKEAAIDLVSLARGKCKGIIFPVNVDLLISSQQNNAIKNIFNSGIRVYADGMPIYLHSQLTKTPLKERIAGSDLMPEFFHAAKGSKLRAFLLGAAPGVGELTAQNLKKIDPENFEFSTFSPEMNFENDPSKVEECINRINSFNPDILFIALGFPKQEYFAYSHIDKINTGPILCVGATLDFLSGRIKRAPVFIRRIGLEWLWRLISEPRRLWKRYLLKGPLFFKYSAQDLADRFFK